MSKTQDFAGKRLLVLGGTPQQLKLVEAAHRLGAYVIVADWLETSVAKRAADAAFAVDIKDVDAICNLCKSEGVAGVICGWIDPAQRPYQQVCERLGLPCYGTAEQFRLMTDKRAFKAMCRANGVGTIPSYTEADVEAGCVDYPVYVKPADSRGSRGQAVCRNADELRAAITAAKAESSDGGVVIERYMAGCQEFQVTYLFEAGRAHLVRTTDSYSGTETNGLAKVVLGAISPSRYTQAYLDCANEAVVRMIKGMGFKNGPVFMQGFVDGGEFRFFDPGLRFPGVDYERVYKQVFGIDLAEFMVRFAFTGEMRCSSIPDDGILLGGKAAAVLFPTLKPGIVGGLDKLYRIDGFEGVITCIPRVEEGETIGISCDVNQRLAEIDVVAEGYADLADKIEAIQSSLCVTDREGRDMLFEVFNADVLRGPAYAGLCS